MDVVYPYKAAPDDFELRYSLRSLENVPHDRVIVAGDRPLILGKKAVHLPVTPVDDRYQSSTANIMAAIEAGISDEFIVMHDDIFVLEPWTFRHEHRGTIDEYLGSGQATGQYRAYTESTRDLLVAKSIADPLWYGLHTPTVYNARLLAGMIEGFAGTRYLLRTLYHNLFPTPAENREDVKVRHWTGEPEGDVLSISDECTAAPAFRRWIDDRFPARSEYEIGSDGRCLILGYAPSVWAEAERALDTGEFAAVIASPEAAEHWPGPVHAIAENDLHAERLARACGFDDVVWCGRSERKAA